MERSALIRKSIPTEHWKAAAYIRLSKEDYASTSNSDSISIQHQRQILGQFAKDNGLTLINEFVDDGYSGANFERPGFQKMIEAIHAGEINCVITKDLSRLGRNHLEVGYYIETFFPENRIRYISINEQFDSIQGDSDLIPFMNIFNELYAKQTSKKNRQVFESKFANGGMHSRYVTYGYIKNPNDKNKRIIDPEAADVVRKVYDLADDGNGPLRIQEWLFNHKIECPSYRIYRQTGLFKNLYEVTDENRKYKWNLSMIRRMLSDMTYLGHSVHYKKRTISFKNKRQRYLPEDQWVIIENTHEPIINKEKFDSVQMRVGVRKRVSAANNHVALFSGLLKCADCGSSLAHYYKKSAKTNCQDYYICGKQAQHDMLSECTPHYIREDVLQEIVLNKIKTLFKEAKVDKQALIKKLASIDNSEAAHRLRQAKIEIEALEKRNRMLNKLLPKVYEDWVEERISEENFRTLSQTYQTEQTEVSGKLKKLNAYIRATESANDPAQQFADKLDKLMTPEKLTREMLYALIDKIVVHEPLEKSKGKRNKLQQIDIHWKYIGPR